MALEPSTTGAQSEEGAPELFPPSKDLLSSQVTHKSLTVGAMTAQRADRTRWSQSGSTDSNRVGRPGCAAWVHSIPVHPSQ